MVIETRVIDDYSNKLICLKCGFSVFVLKDSNSFGKLNFGTWVCPVCHELNKVLV